MKTVAQMMVVAVAAAAGLAACQDAIDAGGSGVDAGAVDDPLAVPDEAPAGSLDDIQRTVIDKHCSGQPGLCHNGQFEPNLSTAALTYFNLVNRPGLEKDRRLRVAPGDPDASLIIDKLRDRNGVATRMPLGAQPLSADDIGKIEDWIAGGALREPGADDPPVLDNPPGKPEIGVFSAGGARLDGAGPFSVQVGDSLVFRHSTRDFETDDDAIPIAFIVLAAADGRNAVLRPDAPSDQHLGITTYDPSGPMGAGDRLDHRFDFTIPAQIGLRTDAGDITMVGAAGLTFTVIALYLDGYPEGIAAYTIRPALMTVSAP